MKKAQRIRDPLHNLIDFGNSTDEYALWLIVQTPEFQRLRRIKQLGFSEMVFPGATHTRFAHSLGAYHIAKKLLQVIRRHQGVHNDTRAQHALTAALVHDVGHGPFSHAFEEVGETLGLEMANHEKVSETIILNSKISKILNEQWGEGFSREVTKLIKSRGPSSNIFSSVVSSQFDADRLDYIQRDRLMTGTHLGGIDFTWLLDNLEVGEVAWGDEDGDAMGTLQTFILGPKAVHAAEAYILGLFQMYPTVYLHKATRGAEKLFTQLLARLFSLAQEKGGAKKSNLPNQHPLIFFAKKPKELDLALTLDDAVVTGALPMLADAQDPLLRDFSRRLRERRLYKCVDVRECLKSSISSEERAGDIRMDQRTMGNVIDDRLSLMQSAVRLRLDEWSQQQRDDFPRILQDEGKREPYKQFDAEKGLLNQILIREYSEKITDIGLYSAIINASTTFKFYRAYYPEGDEKAHTAILDAIENAAKGEKYAQYTAY